MNKSFLLILCCLLAGSAEMNATSVTIAEDSATRLDFTVLWEEDLHDDTLVVSAVSAAGGHVNVTDYFDEVRIDIEGTVLISGLSYMHFEFFAIPRFVEHTTVTYSFDLPEFRMGSFDIIDYISAAQNSGGVTSFGVRFLYEAPVVSTIPDGGGTLGLLGASIAVMMIWCRRLSQGS